MMMIITNLNSIRLASNHQNKCMICGLNKGENFFKNRKRQGSFKHPEGVAISTMHVLLKLSY